MWLKGDTHLHTTTSDGALSREELLDACKKRGLDFIMVTDHNRHGVGEKSFYHKGMLVIPGEEVTQKGYGHMNIWGTGIPTMNGERPAGPEVYYDMAQKAHDAGATVSINHPFDKKFSWTVDLENFPADSYEIWNTVMHGDNMRAIDWWHGELLKGRRLPVVGGSDYHRDYAHITRLLAVPVTYVNAEENTEEAVLKAIREGRVVIANSPKSGQLMLTCGDKTIGDTVELAPDTAVTLTVSKLKARMRVEVFNNDELIYFHKARVGAAHTAVLRDLKPGFVRAQIRYDYPALGKAIYKKAIAKIFPPDAGLPVPSFAWALTNPIWLTEKEETR